MEQADLPVFWAPALGAVEAGVDLVGLDCPEEITLQEPEAGAAEPALAQLVGHGESVAHSSSSVEHRRLDEMELAWLAEGNLIDNPVEHLFLPGLYVRQITNWKGSVLTTKIHKTEHPFFLLKGRLLVRSLDGKVVELVAPCRGVTEPGTRRVIFALEDSVFVTVHPNPDDTRDLDVIEERLIERRELVGGQTSGQLFAERLAARELEP